VKVKLNNLPLVVHVCVCVCVIIDNPSPRVEINPRAGVTKPVLVDHATAACFKDFVDIFCREMWFNLKKQAIKNALTVALKNYQSRYGTIIIPDKSLLDLLERLGSNRRTESNDILGNLQQQVSRYETGCS
jgi:hypothetical protein